MSRKDIESEEITAEEAENAAVNGDLSAEEGVQTKEQGNTETSKKTLLYYAFVGVLVVTAALFVIMMTTVLLFPKNETVEIGEIPNYSYITENPLWGDLCEVVTDVRTLDTSKVGVQTVMLRFFGFIEVRSKLNVVARIETEPAEMADMPEITPPETDDCPLTETALPETDIIESEYCETEPSEELQRETYILDVKNILQDSELPNGCEVVSLAIVLRYMGYDVDPGWLFDNYMPHTLYDYSGDPFTTYIGNPRDYGFGCYAPCVATTGNAYLADVGSSLEAVDVSGMEMSDYKEYIDCGTPVIIWGTTYMNCNPHVHQSWWVNGEIRHWYSNSHCLVLIGYKADTYVFCDPLCGVIEYSIEAVEKSFELNLRQACVIVDGNNSEE